MTFILGNLVITWVLLNIASILGSDLSSGKGGFLVESLAAQWLAELEDDYSSSGKEIAWDEMN